MVILESITYKNDLDKCINSFKEILHELKDCKILITGATGLICSSIVDLLYGYNKLYNGNIQIYIAGRDENKARHRFCDYFSDNNFNFVKYDATRHNNLDFNVDYIIHGASNAYPLVYQKYPVETILGNFIGVNELLNYAYKNRSKRLLFISSSEIYGKKEDDEPFKENEYGSIDILNTRSSYSSGKRAAETLCSSYVNEYGVDSVIVRPGHIFGPTASLEDNRVSSSFAYLAAAGKDLVLKSNGNQVRSYCYMLDAATAILTVLIKGKKGEAYNISNNDSVVSIQQIATLFAEYGKVALKFDNPTFKEKEAFNPMDNSSLNSEKLMKLGWHSLFDVKVAVEHTILALKEATNDG